MERFGPKDNDMRKINRDDTFLGRVKLLVIMLKAFLGDYPLQGIKRKAIAKNAVEVSKICADWNKYFIQVRSASRSNEGFELDHILYQRISLLSIMAKSDVLGNPMGHYRKKIIRDNISYIVDALQINPGEEFKSFVKVA